MAGHPQRWIPLFLLAGLAFLSCGTEPTVPPDEDEDEGRSGVVLTRIGHGTIEVHPGEVHTLRALLQQVQEGPIPGGTVQWEIKGPQTGGATLSVNSSTTDENGLAAVDLHVGDTGRFAIVGTSEGASGSASWQVDVRPVQKFVSITSSGPEFTLEQDNVAKVRVARERTLRVRVRVSLSDNRAVVNERVTFQIVTDPAPEGVVVETTEGEGITWTDGAGEAVAFVQTGLTLQGFDLIAQLDGGSYAQFNFTVSDADGTCRGNDDCLAEQICRNRVCVDRSADMGIDCQIGGDSACPFGFVCNPVTGKCSTNAHSCASGCPGDLICDYESDECIDPDDCETCPEGFACVDDVEICKPVDPENVMDVSGLWFTRHTFDIREGLPSWVQGLASTTRSIHQLMEGQFKDLPSWVNSIVRSLIQQFIPPWVQTLIKLLDSAFTVFSELRADGEMMLEPLRDRANLTGDEYWSSFIFYFLPQCGNNIPNDPAPACARMDIYTDELPFADGSAAVEVFPFTVRVGSGNPATVVVPTRQVNMALAGILKYALDQVVYYTTGYPSLEGPPGRPEEGALYNLVDCAGIGSGVQGFEAVIEIACQVAVIAVGEIIADELRSAAVETSALRFSGQATARPQVPGSPYAVELGFEDFETRRPADGVWNGEFMGMVDDVPGRWRASRRPFF